MKVRFVWMTDLTQSDRPTWKGEMDAVPSEDEHVTIYGPKKDKHGFCEVLAAGYVKSRLWGLSADGSSDVEVRLQ